MNQIKAAGEVTGEVSQSNVESIGTVSDMDVRTLKDLELVLVGGGSDAVPCW